MLDTLIRYGGSVRWPIGSFVVSYPRENSRNGGYLAWTPMVEPERWSLYVELGHRAFDALTRKEG